MKKSSRSKTKSSKEENVEDLPILIGSRAGLYWDKTFRSEINSDWDLLATKETVDSWKIRNQPQAQLKDTTHIPGQPLSLTFSYHQIPIEFIVPESSSSIEARVIQDVLKMKSTLQTTDFPGGRCMVAPLILLIALKRSHLYWDFKWQISIEDYHRLRLLAEPLPSAIPWVEELTKSVAAYRGPIPSEDGVFTIGSESKTKERFASLDQKQKTQFFRLANLQRLCTQSNCRWLSDYIIENYPAIQNDLRSLNSPKDPPIETKSSLEILSNLKLGGTSPLLPKDNLLLVFGYTFNYPFIQSMSRLSKEWKSILKRDDTWKLLYRLRWSWPSGGTEWGAAYKNRSNIEHTRAFEEKEMTRRLRSSLTPILSIWRYIGGCDNPESSLPQDLNIKRVLSNASCFRYKRVDDPKNPPERIFVDVALWLDDSQLDPIILKVSKMQGTKGSSRFTMECIEIECTVAGRKIFTFDALSLKGRTLSKWGPSPSKGDPMEGVLATRPIKLGNTWLPSGFLACLIIRMFPDQVEAHFRSGSMPEYG